MDDILILIHTYIYLYFYPSYLPSLGVLTQYNYTRIYTISMLCVLVNTDV